VANERGDHLPFPYVGWLSIAYFAQAALVLYLTIVFIRSRKELRLALLSWLAESLGATCMVVLPWFGKVR
jgi:hypothetical protein